MFQVGLAEIIQADREREIAELVRQRRLLEPEVDVLDRDPSVARRPEPQRHRAPVRATGR